MARYNHIDTSPRFIAVDLQRQLQPGMSGTRADFARQAGTMDTAAQAMLAGHRANHALRHRVHGSTNETDSKSR